MKRFERFLSRISIARTLMIGSLMAAGLPLLVHGTMPESTEARRRMLDYMIAPLQPHQDVHRQVIRQRGESMVFFRTYEQLGNRYFVFTHMDSDGEWDLVSPGTWIIRRRIEDGAFEQVKIFLQNDEDSFLRLFPGDRTRLTRMDVEIAGVSLYRNVPVPMTMERAITAPFSLIREGTAGVVDWSLLEPDPTEPGYRRIENMVNRLRELLPVLHDADDGAMDHTGELVFIETLEPQPDPGGFNCSGFAKWVVDGLYRPRAGDHLPIDPLKERHIGFRGTSWTNTLEEKRDPFFGLDWTRNLARYMYAVNRSMDPGAVNPGTRDVVEVRSADRIDHVGYRMEDLRHVLYRLALLEPGTFYLGSVNRSFGEAPVLRQHTHVVVLLPWFDGSGRFRVAVMERNHETSTASLVARYRGDFIHLVRISAEGTFDPHVPDHWMYRLSRD